MALFLVYQNGKFVGRRVDVGKDGITVGRDSDCDLCVDGAKVSRHHSKLSWSGDSIVIEDLGSSNGTWVNGEKITGPCHLKLGDQVIIGPQYFRLCDTSGRTRPIGRTATQVLMIVVIVVLSAIVIWLVLRLAAGNTAG